MASIIIPGKWTKQPQYPVEIDRNVITSRAPSIIWTPNNGIVEKTLTPTINGLDKRAGPSGVCSYHDNVADVVQYASPAGPGDWTIFAVFDLVSTANGQVVAGITHASNAYGMYFSIESGNLNLVGMSNGNWRLISAGAPIANKRYYVVGTGYNNGTRKFYVNGNFAGEDTTGRDFATLQAFTIGRYGPANSSSLLGRVYLAGAINEVLPNALEISRNPWQIFKKRPNIFYFDVGGATGVTGTGSLTTATETLSGAGVIGHTGTGALTTSEATLSGSGTLTHTGTGALTTLAATLAGAGVLTHVGTGALTTGVTTLAGEGTVSAAGAITGTGALTISAVTASGAGTIGHVATGDLQASVVTLDGAGVLSHTGTGDLTTGDVTLSGVGEGPAAVVVPPVAGGGGGTVTVSGRKPKRQKLILVERVEDVEELIEQVEEIVQAEPKARKLKLSPKKPKQTVQNAPEAAFDWLAYYAAKLDTLRDQQRAIALKRQLDKNAEIIRAILAKQQEDARIQQEFELQREEEEFMLLLMAA